MTNGFRRYTAMNSSKDSSSENGYAREKAKFHENTELVIGYALHGSGPSVAIFDYGYFGEPEDFIGSDGGRGGSGGGYKIASDSKVSAPSPFKGGAG